MTFEQYLLVGSYLFTTGAYALGYKILKALERIEQQLVYRNGFSAGQGHEQRLRQLESQESKTKRAIERSEDRSERARVRQEDREERARVRNEDAR